MIGTLLKMFTGNPVTMIYVAAAIFAVGVGIGGTTGWAVNGWRLGFLLEHAERERDHWKDQTAVVADAAKACKDGVDRTERVAAKTLRQGQALLEQARRLSQAALSQAARIEEKLTQKPPAGADCNAAWGEIEKAGAP